MPGGDPSDTIDETQPSGQHVPKPVLIKEPAGTRRTDFVRAGIAGWLLALVTIIIFYAEISANNKDSWVQGEKVVNILLPAVIGILGSVIGFYFGSRNDAQQPATVPEKKQ